jgi:hypothetical protein
MAAVLSAAIAAIRAGVRNDAIAARCFAAEFGGE